MEYRRVLQARNDLISRLRTAYSCAVSFGFTHDQLLEATNKAYGKCPKGTPDHVKMYARGYCEARNDELYERHLVFGGFVKGAFYSVHSGRSDYYGKHGICPSAWADDGIATAKGHYWSGRPDKPFFLSRNVIKES